MLALALAIHAAAAIAVPLTARRLGRGVFIICALAAAGTLAVLVPMAPDVLGGTPVVESYSWAAALGLEINLRLDAFSMLMVALISGVGLLVSIYGYGYFGPDKNVTRLAASLTTFAGAMLGLVLSDHLLVAFTFWELTSITSYLLIGTDDTRDSARSAALQALLTTGAGALAMMAGFVILGHNAGTYQLSEILAAPPSGTAVNVALVLVLLGAFTKSAQAPFHAWLPGAMAAPTPVSAYLHSATMVKAGVYIVARFAPAFADAPTWHPTVLTVGLITMLLGGWRALRQHDLKLVLAYGTVSQLGFLTLVFGVGTPETTLAGAALLLAHGAFKASLFMTVGVVDHQTHTRDIRRLSGLARALPVTTITAIVAAASMAGLPPLLGFVAKEAVFEALLHTGDTVGVVLITGVVLGSILTVAYTARYVWGAFATKRPNELGSDVVTEVSGKPARTLEAPAVVLAAVGLVLGVLPALGSPLIVGGARALDNAVPDSPLALWHGFNLALGLSVVAVAAGAFLWWKRASVETFQAAMPKLLPDAGKAYGGAVNGSMRAAERITSVVQSGSLPVYLGIILLTLIVLPGSYLLRSGAQIDALTIADHPLQIPVGLLIIVAAVVTSVIHHRFAAVIALGAVGYGIAMLFVLQGAPDLAITQLLVETLVLVLFVLVLRHLPERFQARRWQLGQGPRLVIAIGVGVLAAGFTAIAVSARNGSSVAAEYLARAVPDGGGLNVVNVILVDFRGFDTFGEIVVLAASTLGVVALVRAARRDRGIDDLAAPAVNRSGRRATATTTTSASTATATAAGTSAGTTSTAPAAAAPTPAAPATTEDASADDTTESSGTGSDDATRDDTSEDTTAQGLAPNGAMDIDRRRRSLLLDTGVRAVFRPILLFSVYLVFAGHNAPGGGFIGGLVAGAALVLIAISYGAERLRQIIPISAETLLGGGIVLAGLSGAWGWVDGGEFLSRASTTVEIPLLGELYVATTITFDLGVYFVVVGLVVALLRSLGSEKLEPT